MAIESLLGNLPLKWETITLGDACQRGGGFIQTGPFGSQLHASDYVEVGIPSIMPKNIGDNRVVPDGIARITEKDAKRLERYLVRSGDIVYSRRGDVERRALITEQEDGWLCGTGCLRVRFGSFDYVDPLYASYYLGDLAVREWIVRHAIGATMPNLNTSILSALPFVLPPLPEQRAIARILGALDDKIELNRRMNATIESMARVVFRQWFVENEEVKEWKVGLLSDIAYIVKGVSYRSIDLVEESDTALVTLKSMERGGGYREDGLKPYAGEYKSGQKLSPGEVVIAHTDLTQAADVIGRAARIETSEKHPNLVASLDMAIVRPKEKPYTNEYIFGVLSQVEFSDHAYGYTNGTTVLHLSSKALQEYQFRIPPKNKVKEFSDLVLPIFLKIDNNKKESRTLGSLRDSLLPKLMRGEVRVKDVEEKL